MNMEYMAEQATQQSGSYAEAELARKVLETPLYVHLHGIAGMFKLVAYNKNSIVIYTAFLCIR